MPATRQRLRTWAGILAGIVLATGMSVLLAGWGGGLDWLVRFRPGAAAMVPATAASLAALAAAQLLQLRQRPGPPLVLARLLARLLALAVAAFAAAKCGLTVAAYLAAPPGSGDRMALATSAGLVLAAAGTLASGGRGALADAVTSALGAAGVLLTLTAIGTWLLDRPAYEAALAFAGMAPHSAAALLLLCISAMLARPDFRLARTAFGEGPGSRSARRLLPLLLLGPLLVAELALEIGRRGWLDPSIWSAALAALLALSAVVTVLRLAAYRNREDARRQEEEWRLRIALDGIDAAVFVFGADRRLRLANLGAERLCGGAGPPGEWLFGARFHALGSRRILAAEESPARRLLARDGPAELHAGWLDPEGAEHALRFVLRRQAAGGFLVLSVLDETQGWLLRENLARTERLDAVGQMAGGISHEMANIFGVIRLGADTALLSGREEVLRRHLGAIQAACVRGADLTERLVELTRTRPAAAARLDLRRELASLEPVLRAALPAGIGLAIRCDGAAPLFLRASAGDLQAALLNLVLNARNAILDSGAPGGTVALSVQGGAAIRITVRDDGPGMPAAVAARALDPFFTTRLERGGSGLGLAMVENFVRRAGGSVTIDTVPGEGTSVMLDLPAAGPDGPDAPEEAGSAAPPELHGLQLLVIEDDAALRSVVAELLALLGAGVEQAAGAEDALARLRGAGPVDAMLCDIHLPGALDGRQLATAARAIRPGLPVIYMTGYAAQLASAPPEVPGLVLRKPAGSRELANAIKLALSRPEGRDPPA
ncbi:ATP-binding protein [Poseidonocella sp. HB161398]|uniref:hybrid sensor histidine kinase/response regulator n=1 Tax=Poseidonocella sp. HB161398 TaxID=2320855 RepID=UPI0011098997|nr:ATP-binding protein [Poseidonocella sp. HB161398]